MYESVLKSMENGVVRILSGVATILYGKPADLSLVSRSDKITLPRDMYAHSNVQTEWWYYTGHCTTASGKRFGFELVFFKRQTDYDRFGILPLRLLANPMYAAQFAVADIKEKRFRYRDRRSFGFPRRSSASASEKKFELSIGDWNIYGSNGSHVLSANLGDEFVFNAIAKPTKPIVLNGHQNPDNDSKNLVESSNHFSYTRMQIEGEIVEKGVAEKFTGSAWMDREFGTWYQRNWDWFSIQLDDETELLIYEFRGYGSNRQSHGTFVDKDGKYTYLRNEDFSVRVKGKWKSPRTEIEYPSGWSIRVDKLGIELEVIPFLEDQELDTRSTTTVLYWEGACRVSGTRLGKDARGSAYAELVGYDGSAGRPTLTKFLRGLLQRRVY